MLPNVECSQCKAVSRAGAGFCHRCGASLANAPPAPPTPMPSVASFPPLTPGVPAVTVPPMPPPASYEFRKDIDRTRTGALLLAVGALLSWIPVIGLVGGLLTLIGAILVILGRAAFGDKHARNVGIAILLFVIGLVGGLVLAGGVLSAVAQAATLPPDQLQAAVMSAFNTLLVGAILLGVITGPATVFFLWELLDPTGKILILISYLAGIAIACFVYVVIIGQVGAALSAAFATSPPDVTPIVALDNQINGLKLLDAIPSLLTAAAAGLAWSRIDSGKIPTSRF